MAGIEVQALAKNVHMSPRKVRVVGNIIRGKPLSEALAMLRFMPQRSSRAIAKAVRSAGANAENNLDLDPKELYVVRVHADKGLTLRRYRAKARGRAGGVRKRWSHITVIVAERGS